MARASCLGMSAPVAGAERAGDTLNERAISNDDPARMISLPVRARQRLRFKMAEPRPPVIRSFRASVGPWSSQRLAEELVPLRDRLVDRLPREIAAARDLSRDQRELVIDDAIDFMVTQYAKPVTCHEELDRAFWASASYRVKRAHELRGATIRAGYQRVDVDGLELVASTGDPESAAVERDEELTLLEFAATLTAPERQVFACKYGSGPKVQGRNVVSRRLGLPIGEVRKAERDITRKLERFVSLMSAGALCSYRSEAISSLAETTATRDQTIAARVHLERCPSCRKVYAAHVRALRNGELQRRLAGLLPMPPAAHSAANDRGIRSLVADWLARPFAGDHAAAATQIVSSGAGRGAGGILAAKLAALCVSGAALTSGAVCVSLGVLDTEDPAPQHGSKPAERRSEPRPAVTWTPREPRPVRTVVASKRTRPTGSAGTDTKTPARAHEQTPASPAPANAQPGGGSEFLPSAATGSAPPATAPSTGMPEFP